MRAAALSHCPYALASNAAGIPSCAPAPAASCQPAAAPSPATQTGEGWTCELEGQKIRHNFKGAYLHAMGQPADGKTLQLSEAVELVTALPLKEADDVGTIRSGLQKKAAGKWTLKYVCSHASKCSCPYTLELRHPAGSEVVSVWQTAPHQFHDPTSADSQAQLRMHPRLEAMATVMIESGAKPTSICTRLNNMVHDPADPLGLGGGTTGLQHFSSARVSIIPRQIYVLIKKLWRAEGLGLTSDGQAMAALIDELRREGSVLSYQPYKQAGRRSGEQPLVIVMQASFQARMLDQFGRRLVCMDATFGVNKYGYPL